MNNPSARTAIGYTRLSKAEVGEPSVSPQAQEAAIREYADREGMTIVDVFHEPPGASGRNLKRPYLQATLSKLATGGADALICSRLDRFSRDVGDLAAILKAAEDEGWALILLDVSIDTRTPEGEHFANTMASFAQLERKRIGQRTKTVLDQKRREGVQLGRPSTVKPTTVTRLKRLRGPADNPKRSPYGIAKELNERGVKTDSGGQWTATTVRRILSRG